MKQCESHFKLGDQLMNLYLRSISVFVLAFSSSVSWAVPIAIIDSGTDLKHNALVNNAWNNPGNLPGDEFQNDQHGWNFAENNNQIIDYSYLGKFSSDPAKFFEIQLKTLQGTATEEEKAWVAEKKKDQNFIKELSTFANFVHGTHVAGIASRSAKSAQIMGAKIIPTEVKLPASLVDHFRSLSQNGLMPFSFNINDTTSDEVNSGPMDDIMMQMALSFLASQQSKTLEPVGKYVGVTGMKVANCSFGTGFAQAKIVVSTIAKAILKRDLNDAEAEKYATSFLGLIIQNGTGFVTSAGKTLFVIAAGNDGSDNDKRPTYPANLKMDNTITVAATHGYDRIASFSNFGATTVDIAAPGVGITSSIPTPSENESMTMSGTSQASPFIANLAGKVMDENPSLSLTDVKKILMGTVDKKSFLEGKVVSGGIANEERAIRAAKNSVRENLDAAILHARTDVRDIAPRASMRMRLNATVSDVDPVPMPSLFQMN